MAYEQWQQTPQGIESMYNANVANGGGSIAATPDLMTLLSQQKAADALTAEDQRRQLAQNYQMDPLRVQQQQLANDTTAAELPGRKAQSISAGVKAKVDLDTMQSAIERALAENGAKATGAHADELGSIGTILQQHAAGIGNNPLGAGDRTRALFKNLGIESMMNPNFDQMDPVNQMASIRDLGGNFQDASAKARMAIQKYEMQGNTARDVASERSRATIEAANLRKQASDRGWEAKESISKDHQKLQEAAVQEQRFAQAAADAGDQQAALAHMARSNEYFARAAALAQAPATVNTGKAVDLDALQKGRLEQRSPQPPTAPPANTSGAVPGAAAAPRPAAPAGAPAGGTQAAIPPGRVMVRDVKTGRMGHIPAEQLDQALQNGYELVNSNGVR